MFLILFNFFLQWAIRMMTPTLRWWRRMMLRSLPSRWASACSRPARKRTSMWKRWEPPGSTCETTCETLMCDDGVVWWCFMKCCRCSNACVCFSCRCLTASQSWCFGQRKNLWPNSSSSSRTMWLNWARIANERRNAASGCPRARPPAAFTCTRTVIVSTWPQKDFTKTPSGQNGGAVLSGPVQTTKTF